jgi:2-polyprenyl-3-methyl-5-hydroxy-6-metoxy-1,4-benzoquinol methylase
MYTYSACPVCGEKEFTPFISCKDHTVSQETFQIVSCLNCSFKFTHPRPHDEDLGKYYQSDDYISHSDTKKGLISRLYHQVRNRTLKQKLELIGQYVSRGTVLDYGCGTGYFLDYCGRHGWKGFGLEPDKGARKIAFESGLNVSENKTILEQKTADLKFNAITLWHVLEHVTDLEATLSFFRQKLMRDGVIVIAVPNHQSYDAKHYGEHWAAYDVPRHLYHFEPSTIEALMKRHGFTLETMHPMKFDSYYVSMLSEKYKTGRINYPSAFINGFRSNLAAKSPADFSSVIYIFR